ncbi:MAG: PKD domain-containing protein [Pseudomonadota bacterium]
MKFPWLRLSVVLLSVFGAAHPAIAGTACTEGCVLQRATALASEFNSEAAAVADLNADGRPDIVAVAGLDSDVVYVYYQAADGSFPPPVAYRYGGPLAYSNSVDTGDLNGDGRADVAVTTYAGIRVMLQDAQGRLSSYRDYPVGYSTRVRVADLNNDGRADVVTTSGVRVLYQNAGGTLDDPVTYPVDASANDLETGDLNHDGLTDIVLANNNNNSYPGIAVLLQSPGGGFQPAVHYDLPTDAYGHRTLPGSIGVGDVTGDGRADLVASQGWNYWMVVFAQNAAGALNPPVVYTQVGGTSDHVGATAVADMNQDGRQDVVALHEYGRVSVLLQRADGTLAVPIYHVGNIATSAPNPHSLAVGDLDGDGKTDVVVAKNTYFQGVDLYRGTRADLRLTLAAERASGLVGQPTRYTATIVNNGPDVAARVRFTHTTPAGMFLSGMIDNSQGSCDDNKRVCELGALDPGQSATVAFETYAYNAPGEYTVSATVTAYPYDIDAADNSAAVTLPVAASADLQITSHGVSRSGDEIRYSITVYNDGLSAAPDVVVHDTLPAGVTPTAASWSEWIGSRSGTCSISGSEVRCEIGAMPVTDIFDGAYPVIVSVRGSVNTTENLLNLATVSAGIGDPRPENSRSARLSTAQGVAINQPPVIDAGGPYNLRYGASAVLDARGTRDPEATWLSYFWTLPDGSSGYGGQTRHLFRQLGTVPVALRVTDEDGGVADDTLLVSVSNAAPVARLAAPYQLRRKKMEIYFDARDSYDVDGGVLQYFWDFGDGATGSGETARHAYARGGEYLATVTAADGAATAAAGSRVIVLNAVPVANAGGPYGAQKNQAVAFDGSRSTDGDYDPLTYSWNFGDGGSGSGVNPSHSYARGGVYSVSLVVNDGETDSAPATTTVSVQNHAPVANAGGPYETVKGVALTLDGSASSDPDNDSLSYRWNFGDGSSGSGVRPVHTYAKSGRYKVTLIVNDGELDSAPHESLVTVKNR